MRIRSLFLVLFGGFAVAPAAIGADEVSLDRGFETVVQPFLKSQCLGCHGAKKQEGKLDLSGDASVEAIVKNHKVWDLVLERLETEEMPPDVAPRQPTKEERRAVVAWIKALRDSE